MTDRTAPAKEASAEPLKPCPFCGGSEIFTAIGEECGSYRLMCRSEICDVEVATYSVETEEDAIAAWNRRSSPVREGEEDQERILPTESDMVQNKEEV